MRTTAKNMRPPSPVWGFWGLTSLVAHSLAAPVDTVKTPVERNSPCLPRPHSSRSCARRRRTSFCKESPVNPSWDRKLRCVFTAWMTFPQVTGRLNLRAEDAQISHQSNDLVVIMNTIQTAVQPFTYLFLCRVSVPEYASPWNKLYWKGDALMRGKVIKKWTSGSPQSPRFMVEIFSNPPVSFQIVLSSEGLRSGVHESPPAAASLCGAQTFTSCFQMEVWMWRFGNPSSADKCFFSPFARSHTTRLASKTQCHRPA